MRFSFEVGEDVLSALFKFVGPGHQVRSAITVAIERDETGWPIARSVTAFTDGDFDELTLLQLARDSINESIEEILTD